MLYLSGPPVCKSGTAEPTSEGERKSGGELQDINDVRRGVRDGEHFMAAELEHVHNVSHCSRERERVCSLTARSASGRDVMARLCM